MRVRYKSWNTDGLNVHVVSFGLKQVNFLDEDQGVVDVRDKATLEFLLRHPSHLYELDWAHYGVGWDAQDQEIGRVLTASISATDTTSSWNPTAPTQRQTTRRAKRR